MLWIPLMSSYFTQMHCVKNYKGSEANTVSVSILCVTVVEKGKSCCEFISTYSICLYRPLWVYHQCRWFVEIRVSSLVVVADSFTKRSWWHVTSHSRKNESKKKKERKKKQAFCPKVQLPPMNHCKLSALSHPLTHGIMGYWGCWCHRCECVRTVYGAGASQGSVICPPPPSLPHPFHHRLLQYPSSHSHGGPMGYLRPLWITGHLSRDRPLCITVAHYWSDFLLKCHSCYCSELLTNWHALTWPSSILLVFSIWILFSVHSDYIAMPP